MTITDKTVVMTLWARLLRQWRQNTEPGGNVPLITKDYTFKKTAHPQTPDEGQGWTESETSDALNTFENTESRAASVCVQQSGAVVRRLTPLECERLQGFPDGWTDIGEWTDTKGKKHKTADSSRYKALGNSIALPFWEFLAARMIDFLKSEGVEQPTMASLFDGIGGFPLVYSRHGCRPVWASEIEEFPIAVTKIHFSESEGAGSDD